MKTVPTWISMVAAAAVTVVLAQPVRGALTWNWDTDYTGNEEGTHLLWKFENTGTEMEPFYGHDSSGNGHNASFSANQTELGVTGRFGLGFRSVGPSQNANVGTASGGVNAFDTSRLVVELWFKPYSTHPGADSSNYLVDKMRVENAGMWFRVPTTAGGTRLQAQVGNGTSTMNVSSSNLAWDTDTWYHLAVTYTAATGTLNIFRNGTEVATNTNASFGELANSSQHWRLGNRLTSIWGHMPGDYDNFRVSNIPEPNVLGLIGIGLAGTLLRRRLHG